MTMLPFTRNPPRQEESAPPTPRPPPPRNTANDDDDVTICSDDSTGPVACEHAPPAKRKGSGMTVFVSVLTLLGIAGVVVCGVCRGVGGCGALRQPPSSSTTSTVFWTREEAITNWINENSYYNNNNDDDELLVLLSPDGSRPEELALSWLIYRDPLQLNAGTNETEKWRLLQRYSLLTLWFQGNTGITWADATNWLIDEDECTWAGVGCENNDDGVVTAIRFFAKGLQGSISPDLGLLTDLTEVDLGRNDLMGSTLPSSIGQWSNLRSFNVRFCDLSGSLPSEMGAWTNLELLDVSLNRFTGTIPESIANWKAIERASFCSNDFSGSVSEGICEAIITEQGGYLYADPDLPCPSGCCTRCIE